jgi:hypothetical protein
VTEKEEDPCDWRKIEEKISTEENDEEEGVYERETER